MKSTCLEFLFGYIQCEIQGHLIYNYCDSDEIMMVAVVLMTTATLLMVVMSEIMKMVGDGDDHDDDDAIILMTITGHAAQDGKPIQNTTQRMLHNIAKHTCSSMSITSIIIIQRHKYTKKSNSIYWDRNIPRSQTQYNES